MNVTIGICTYLRPKLLDATLRSLSQLESVNNVVISLCIVDNDIEQSAKKTVEKWEALFPFRLYYLVEEKKGIVYARNRVLHAADELDTDLLLFIDDDEQVEKNWLKAHLDYYQAHNSDVVRGPVYPIYSESTPDWIIKGKFFEIKEHYREGERLPSSATGNVMFDFKKLYHEYGLKFDERLTSREDIDFFASAVNKGARIEWTHTAKVYETVPLSKMNTRWILARAYKGGESFAKREIKYKGVIKGRLMTLMRIPYYIIQGLILLPVSLILGYSYVVKAFRRFSLVIGIIAGVMGANYDDYQSIHGH